MDQHRRLAILLVVGLVLLAGCADAGPAGQTQAPNPGSPSPTAAATPIATATEVTTPNPTPRSTPDASPENGTLTVHFINVGQSTATLLVGPTGETLLIDSGDWRDEGEQVIAYLQRHDINRIDYLITSHADADHIGGHAAVIEHFESEADGIGAVYDPGVTASTQTYQRYLEAIERHNVTLFKTRRSDRIPFAGVQVRVLAPPEQNLAGGDRNENSLVLRLVFGQTSFLFTGDAEDTEEQYLVSQYDTGLKTTVMKSGHHGSKTSTGDSLLDAAKPRIVVISSAYDSQFGHPNRETLERLAARQIPTYWTAVHGSIVFKSNGTFITVRVQQAATTDPLALRDASAVSPDDTSPVQQVDIIRAGQQPETTPTPVVTDGGTPTPARTGQLAVTTIHADAAGNDNTNLNDEYITFTNTGDRSLDLSGWTVRDEAGHTYTFPEGITLSPDEEIMLHTGTGTDTATDLYWGAQSAVWNNAGDTITVITADGETVLEESYS